jgi:creatinine amidohydrolase/Fe(II)-dependent formamide hydrolase-like protein
MDRRRFLALATAGALAPASPRAAAPERKSNFIDDLTWIEVRDAVASGAVVALVPTGGSEANGPQLAIGKHNLIVRYCAGEIARRLGNALVAPVLSYVPEGDVDPPTANMVLPGTIGVSEPAFAAVLRGAAASLAHAGFRLVCFLGDHGLSQPAQESVAASLTRRWRKNGVRVASLAGYYGGEETWLLHHGFTAAEIGDHAGLIDTSELMAVDAAAVRAALLAPATWPASAGASGNPARATAEIGNRLLALKIDAAVAEIRALEGGLAPPPRN